MACGLVTSATRAGRCRRRRVARGFRVVADCILLTSFQLPSDSDASMPSWAFGLTRMQGHRLKCLFQLALSADCQKYRAARIVKSNAQQGLSQVTRSADCHKSRAIVYVCAAEVMNSANHSGVCRGCPEESPEKISCRYNHFKGPTLDVVRMGTLIMGITTGDNTNILHVCRRVHEFSQTLGRL